MGENPIDQDKCDFCPEIATVGVTGVQDGAVTGSSYCESCYNKTNHTQESKPAREEPEYPDFTEKGFKIKSLNSGVQLVLKKGLSQVDFWPSSEKWISRSDQSRGQGKQSLFEHFGV